MVSATRLREDAAIGIVLSVFFGAGVFLLSLIQSLGTGREGGLHHFIYGQTAAMGRTDALLMVGVAGIVAALAFLLLKEFRLVCFDQDFAAVQGWPVSRIDLCMMTLVVTITVVGLQAVGMLLVVAMLIIPAVAARFWTEKFHIMLVLSGIFGALGAYVGAVCSALLPRMPAGAVIVLCTGAVFIFSFLFAPKRGLIAASWRLLKLRLRVAEDHVLRDIYEVLERKKGTDFSSEIDTSSISRLSHLPWGRRFLLLAQLRYHQLISGGRELRLTKKGLERAAQFTRNHRLWEEYLVTHSKFPSSHVDYSADRVEHVLSSQIVRELEESLKEKGRMPASVHPL